jgi:hypothetical protein
MVGSKGAIDRRDLVRVDADSAAVAKGTAEPAVGCQPRLVANLTEWTVQRRPEASGARGHRPAWTGIVKRPCHIRRIYAGSHGTYGAPRVHAELKADGLSVGRTRIARLMRAAGIAGVSRKLGQRLGHGKLQIRYIVET